MFRLTKEEEWKLISAASAVVAALLVRAAVRAGWGAAADDEPPLNPLSQDADWRSAVVFAAAVGVGAGLARLGARALATLAWERKA